VSTQQKNFNFSEFVNETIGIITSPGSYFSSLGEGKGWVSSIIKIFLYVAIAELVAIIPMTFKGQFFDPGMYLMISCSLLVVAIPILFFGTLLLLIISAICGGNTNFKSNLRVIASAMIVYPLSAFMSIFYNINVYFQAILSALVTLYGLYILYLGLIKALGAKSTPAFVILAILAIFPIYSSGKTVYYKAHGLKLPHEQEAERIEERRKEVEKNLKQKELLPENYNYTPNE